MDNFKCDICAKTHNIFKAVKAPRPEKVLEIPETELEQRVKEIGNGILIDEKIFLLQGDIFIYTEKSKEPFFNWSVWASISLDDFKKKSEELKERKNVVFKGELETMLPFYEKTKGLKVSVIVNINYDYAVIKVDEESQIKKDQSGKISEERIIQIMQKVFHPPQNS